MYLITGSRGQLGRELAKRLPHALLTDSTQLDLTDRAAVERFVRIHGVTHIINCAAYTAVDAAEDDPHRAQLLNVHAPRNMAATGAILVHLSTDYVFNGRGCRPYEPEDAPAPLNVYGATKYAGEQAVLETAETAIILRTSWLYAPHGSNFVRTMRRLGAERKRLRVVADQIGSPTSAGDLAEAIALILPQIKKGRKAIYHYANEGVASWYDFACEIMSLSGLACRVEAISSEAYPTRAKRPFYSVLSKERLKNDFHIAIPHWKESLSLCLQQF